MIYQSFISAIVFFLSFSLVLAKDEPRLVKNDAHQQITQFIESELDDSDVHGLSVAIVHGETTWYERGFGYANKEKKLPARVNTQYRLGAISSIFTTLLVLKLDSDGLLSLDAKVSDYIPGLQFKTRDGQTHEITLRQLLTHHSGLPLSVLKGSWSENPADYTTLFEGERTLYLSQAPDTIYTYSNIGFGLLGLIVESLTKKPFEVALQENILDPLALRDTGVSRPGSKADRLAVGYKKKERKPLLYPRDLPSLGIYSDADDLVALLGQINRALHGSNDTLLSHEQVTQMMRIQNNHVPLDLGKKVGLGWIISGMGVRNAGRIVWRGGASLYHRSRIAILPDKQLGIVVLTNDTRGWELAERIAERALEIALQSLYDIHQPEDKELEHKKVEPYGKPDDFADYYTSFLGYIPVEKNGQDVKAKLLGWSIVAKPDGTGWYDLQYDLFGFIPIDITWITEVRIRPAKINNHRVIIVLYKGTQHLFASFNPLNNPSKAWRQRLGTYEVANPDALTKAMEVKKGKLVVEKQKLFFLYDLPLFFGLQLKVPLQTVNDELAIIPGLGTALNEAVQVKRVDGKPRLEYSGYMLKREEQGGLF